MSSVLGSAEALMKIATTEATAAQFVLPPAIWINFEFKLSTGKPENVDKAGQKWRDAADKVQKTMDDLESAISAVSAEDWTSDDRKKHEQAVEELRSQLEVIHGFCMAVGIALTVYAYALFAYAVFAVGMGTFIAGLAVAAAAALAGIVTAPAYSGFLATATTCGTITHVATAILAGASQLAAVVFQGGALLAAMLETKRGNEDAFDDYKQAQLVGAASAGANLLQNAANAGLAYVNRGGTKWTPGPKGTPLQQIDLDATRDKDDTWNLGGGATVQTPGGSEHKGGAHVQWGDEGFAGVDGEYEYKSPTGWNAGGKADWNQDEGQVSVTGKGGYDAPITGSGANTGQPNPQDHSIGLQGEGGVTYDYDDNDLDGQAAATGRATGGQGYKEDWKFDEQQPSGG